MAMAKIKETNCPSEGEKREKRDLKRKNGANENFRGSLMHA